MPIPSAFTDLDTNPNNNSPQGSENVGPNANGYIQALGAFVKQIYNGAVKPLATVDFNAQILTNLLAGSTTSTSKDALTGAQVRALAYKVGEQRMWHGAVANIASVWGAGWQLADGTNGTADARDKFIVGAGLTYAPGATGGAVSVALSVGQLPAHNHGVSDPGHGHGVTDAGHVHGVIDPGHAHTQNGATWYNSPGFTFPTSGGGSIANGSLPTASATTGISVALNGSNVSVNSAASGITTTNTGTGTAVPTLPPYYASCILEYTGIGA